MDFRLRLALGLCKGVKVRGLVGMVRVRVKGLG